LRVWGLGEVGGGGGDCKRTSNYVGPVCTCVRWQTYLPASGLALLHNTHTTRRLSQTLTNVSITVHSSLNMLMAGGFIMQNNI